MRLKRFAPIFCYALLSLLLAACKPGAPRDVLSQGKMQDVLYDMHLAQALAQQHPADSIAYYSRLYRDAVLAKYSLTEADFDRSLQWYMRHTAQMSDVYKKLAERLGSGDSDLSGGPMGTGGNGPVIAGDTLSIWQGPSSALLSSQALNRFTFSQPADTAVHAGDAIEWRFNTSWFYIDGDRSAVACLIVKYEGDSVATSQQYLMSQGNGFLSIKVAKRKVQRIEGFVYQCSSWSDRPRLISLTGMRLVRVRQPLPLPNEVQQQLPPGAAPGSADSAAQPQGRRVRDSLSRLRPGHPPLTR